jgi:hypothetical protein
VAVLCSKFLVPDDGYTGGVDVAVPKIGRSSCKTDDSIILLGNSGLFSNAAACSLNHC